MSSLNETIVFYNDVISQSLIVLVEDSIIGFIFFMGWIFLVMQLLKPFRTQRDGSPKDSSFFAIILATIVAIFGTIMTMAIYLDIKMALFGTLRFSYIQALF